MERGDKHDPWVNFQCCDNLRICCHAQVRETFSFFRDSPLHPLPGGMPVRSVWKMDSIFDCDRSGTHPFSFIQPIQSRHVDVGNSLFIQFTDACFISSHQAIRNSLRLS
jgi:hypothetical protein